MRRLAAVLAFSLSLGALGAPASGQPKYDPEPWLADMAQARQAMSAGYANLDWAVRDRGMNLPRVTALTEQRFRAARNETEARRVFEQFLEAFADSHLDVEWPGPEPAPSVAKPAAGQPTPLCRSMNYQTRALDLGSTVDKLPGYTPLDTPGSRVLPAGVVKAGGRTVGTLRIALFGAQFSPELCDRAVQARGLKPFDPCDEHCRYALERAINDRLTDVLAAQLKALAAAGADTLIVDIGGNGGGSGWSANAARTVAPGPLRTWPVALVRHPHHVVMLESRRKDLVEAAAKASGEDRRRLLAAAETASGAIAEVRRPCDRSAYWKGEGVACEGLIAPFYLSGWVDREPKPFASKEAASVLYWPAGEHYAQGAWKGKLLVLVNRHTHSAAEEFAALLQDNRAAVIVGAPSGGAGCGHIDGRITERLKHSGGLLVMPNCSRLRADGSNEVGGVEPDVLVAFRENDTQIQRGLRLAAALPRVLQESDARLAAKR
jgi:hypothetical protein